MPLQVRTLPLVVGGDPVLHGGARKAEGQRGATRQIGARGEGGGGGQFVRDCRCLYPLFRAGLATCQVRLLYEDMHEVTKQGILKISPDTKMGISELGEATIRLRIEDVSKNHQGQVGVWLSRPRTEAGGGRARIAARSRSRGLSAGLPRARSFVCTPWFVCPLPPPWSKTRHIKLTCH